jgi:hypothetical protein
MRHLKNLPIFACATVLAITCVCCGSDDPEPNNGDTTNGGSTTTVDKSSTTNVDLFTVANVYSRNTYLLYNTAMQGFNFDSDGSVWYTECSNTDKTKLVFIKSAPNPGTSILNAKTEYMTLQYFGHGTNTAVEEDGTDRYLWAGCYGTCYSTGQYWRERLIGRVKYVKGATVKTNECDEYFYVGDYMHVIPSIDAEHDLLTVNYNDPNNSSYSNFVVYKLSEAKKAAYGNFNITCTDGFETGNGASTNEVTKVVRAHDLTTLTPVASFRFLTKGYAASGTTYYDWQGFDVYNDRLYYLEGQSNYNRDGNYLGLSYAYLTVFDFTGKVIEERTPIAIASDKTKLAEFGITVLGAVEPEGVKANNGNLYIGFCARGITEDNTKNYQSIFKYDISTK